ncbi:MULTISPECIES: hypothetical protein [unclassified Caballeronia]|jgi:hypothetical protein|uniref:hypothetical protein n=1 Tax=unclassified Caballeronia TaxID=2646786 RepID=UPI00286710ED|nr:MULTISPECIES: hypothetical protein [unclassified Caballeronia]MDR5760105.1 hypothetical protein [Caballeronia sp. LZ035]MDR5781992.1 hypothetical protein [Caballeronia sp. LZ065]MDR5816389.1 hypothetical protein [Caballeronia sp. LZ033]MDR5823056.1 hypothetical protein [Caballeronia sp. LZ043]MDR5837894.1 hypothetical protein [Caballeronia sp. LZ034LL]
MRRHHQVIEKVAFTLLTLSAVVDASYITWEKHPNFRENVTEIVKLSADLSLANPGVGEPTPLVPLAFN